LVTTFASAIEFGHDHGAPSPVQRLPDACVSVEHVATVTPSDPHP
jgi:hypothetical protein